MAVQGSGDAIATAGTVTELKITDGHFSAPLFPGGKIDLVAQVQNDNPIQVTIKSISLNGQPQIGCDASVAQYLSGPAALSGRSYALPAADQLVIPANSTRTLTVHGALSLGADATAGCTVKIPFTITGDGVATN